MVEAWHLSLIMHESKRTVKSVNPWAHEVQGQQHFTGPRIHNDNCHASTTIKHPRSIHSLSFRPLELTGPMLQPC